MEVEGSASFRVVGTTRGYQTEWLCVGLGGQHGFDAVAHIEASSADLDARQ